jgi:formylglycine-generating enzyme required for sulfatase activity
MKTWLTIFALIGAWGIPHEGFSATSSLMEKDPVEMVIIPAGTFIRGSGPGEGRLDEQPKRKIFVNSFAIDKYEVSNATYMAFVEETLHKPPFNVYGDGPLTSEKGISDLPVVQVTWHDAVDYCFWAGKRLPTEAEWEKAARGSDDRLYPWGNEPPAPDRAQFDGEWDGKKTLQKVASLPEGQSSSGVHQLSGNVREWTQDWYDAEYYANQRTRYRNPEIHSWRILAQF